nr:SNF2-related protein [Achromobacter pulmonis]
MKLIQNTGTQRVIDLMRPHLKHGNRLDCVTPSFSLYAFAEIREALSALDQVQLIVPPDNEALELLGTEGDRAARNRLQARWLANQCAKWISEKVALRRASRSVPQGAAVMRGPDGAPAQVVLGSFAFNTSGLGLTPGNPLNLIQASETTEEAAQLAQWFDQQWAGLQTAGLTDPEGQDKDHESVLEALRGLGEHRDPFTIYTLMLHRLFQDSGDEMDEERIVKSATGIRNTVVWKKLFKFQRDGVVGAIDKLNRFGGCIIADSVGLGKTFEALAIIKYHELRNDRVLVLAPKRLRDNWTLYKANDKRNILAADRFNYDVLNHTDLSRDGGLSGDIDLSHVNWGNYDLVVIDESHNFRNKARMLRGDGKCALTKLRAHRVRAAIKAVLVPATPKCRKHHSAASRISSGVQGPTLGGTLVTATANVLGVFSGTRTTATARQRAACD